MTTDPTWFVSDQPTDAVHLMRLDAVAALAAALEAKDAYTEGHSDRVSRYAAAIAAELELSHEEQVELALAGELHDVGKIGVPDELLKKPGRLTAEEHRQVLEHTVTGERILAALFPEGSAVLQVTRWHHERFDGTGFPDGLTGEAIPLVARIVAVADAFDAMTSARPYREPLPRSVAIGELRRSAGSQLDPACVRAFLAVLARREREGRRRAPRPRVRHAVRRARSLGPVPWTVTLWLRALRAVGGGRGGADVADRAAVASRRAAVEPARLGRDPPSRRRQWVAFEHAPHRPRHPPRHLHRRRPARAQNPSGGSCLVPGVA